ncbi:transcription termination factor, mitochondrial [Dendroctonus ponderosae]|uniref:Mitochondrial transcription termination factor n=1 Tax=Dendroctonus ponderosae TaxID=77166 RepID=U4U8Q0_DENPD|nr:transcription termination factor, mitochondrial [Dendroctonus ponderosae]ERL86976.1 hypothetical protein D910_04379 [Dendroctonus ponderosae]KAH1024604.1 hypothetical protein HUJ05_004064 [Dendroctonus ponderosae]
MNYFLTTFRRLLVLEPSTPAISRTVTKIVPQPKSTANAAESKIYEKAVRSEMTTLLGIREIDALRLLTANKKLLSASDSLIEENISTCLRHGLTKDILLRHPFLLYETNLEEKLSSLKELPLDLSVTLSFARMGTKYLRNLQLMGKVLTDRIADIQRMFNVPLEQACQVLATRRFLLWKPLSELEEILSVFSEYQIEREELLRDLWVFKYSVDQITSRLGFTKQHGVKLKTWMIRCPEDVLYKHLKRESDNRDILGENSVTQYLSQKLHCSDIMAKNIIKKHPQLQNKSLLKINLMIDLLYKYGFTPMHICRVPKVLLHSRKTSEMRLKQLKAFGKLPDSLYILTKSQKQYLQHLDNLVKENTKSLTAL